MASKRDYYDILGVSRRASEDDIKRAYRKLAREYHPDVNKAESAAARFAEISEAYEVLSDAEKRSHYDQFGHAASAYPGGGGARPSGTYTWSNVGGGGGSGGAGFDPDDIGSIFEEVFGVGGRSAAGSPFGSSPGARGRAGARARSRPARGEDITVDLHITFMTAVKGGTESVKVQRGGASQTIDIVVPPGIEDGKKLRVRGAGHPARGGATTGGSGDLIATIHIGKHPYFKRDPANPLDILIDLPLTIAEATLGTTVNVPLLKGSVDLTVPAGCTSGQRLRVRGHGICDTTKAAKLGGTPPTGDFYAIIKIVAPEPSQLSPSDKETLRDMAKRLPNPRMDSPYFEEHRSGGSA